MARFLCIGAGTIEKRVQVRDHEISCFAKPLLDSTVAFYGVILRWWRQEIKDLLLSVMQPLPWGHMIDHSNLHVQLGCHLPLDVWGLFMPTNRHNCKTNI